MKKRFICFLMALCMIAALLPVSALAAGSVSDPWDLGGGVKAAIVNGYELRIFGAGAYVEPAAGSAPWAASASKITAVAIESGITALQPNGAAKPFASCPNMTAMTVDRTVGGAALDVADGNLPASLKVQVNVSGAGNMPDGTGSQLWADLIPNIYVVEIKEGVTDIGRQAFYGCENLKLVTIPSSVTSVGKQAFYNTGVTAVTLKHDFTNALVIEDAAFPANVKLTVEITGGGSGWNYSTVDQQPWSQYRSNITSVVIGENCTYIAGYAFASCNGLKDITINFRDNGAKGSPISATKFFGNNWLWNVDEKNYIITIKAVSANNAFKEWQGTGDLTAVSRNAANTFMEYAMNNSLSAIWQSVITGINIDPATAKNFGDLEYGYAVGDVHSVTVTNSGNSVTSDLVVQLTGGNVSAFTLSKTRINALAINASDSFTVAPTVGMNTGSYKSTVSITDGEGNAVKSFEVSYTVGTDYSRAESFVKRLYQYALGREAEAAGLAHWSNLIAEGKITAAEVAAGFFGSEEQRNRKLSDEQFIKNLYLAMMDRAFDAGGLATWQAQINAGKSRSFVFKQFVDSKEFKALCERFGLPVGTIDYTKYNMGASSSEVVVDDKVVVNVKIVDFVKRLYSVVLGRAAEANGDTGWKMWSEQLATKKNTGSGVAAGFFASPEYRARKRTDAEFLTDLYKVVFDRAVDASGQATWTKALSDGKSRAQVFKEICASPEFNAVCAAAGITTGTIDPKKYDMGASTLNVLTTENATAFVNNLYEKILARPADEGGRSGYVDRMVNKGASGAQIAIELYVSEEFTNKHMSNDLFVQSLYGSLLGRTGSAAEVAGYVKKLTDGKTRSEIFAEFCASTEYKTRCSGLKVTPGSIKAASYSIH